MTMACMERGEVAPRQLSFC